MWIPVHGKAYSSSICIFSKRVLYHFTYITGLDVRLKQILTYCCKADYTRDRKRLDLYSTEYSKVVSARSRNSKVGIATGYGLDGESSIPGRGNRFFSSTRRPKRLWSPPIQYVPRAVSPEVKRHGREADYSVPSSAEVKNGGAIPPPPIRIHSVVLN
jgi:hypothetical protein